MSLPWQQGLAPMVAPPSLGPNISSLCAVQADLYAILCQNSQNLPKCHGKGRSHNILHGSIESAISENPLVGANISSLSAIQADL